MSALLEVRDLARQYPVALADGRRRLLHAVDGVSFSLMGGIEPSWRLATERWMIFVVGKKDAAPMIETSVSFTQNIGSCW